MEPAVPVEHENAPEVQLQQECSVENALPGREAGEAVESRAGFGTKGSPPSQSWVVLKLSFPEGQRFSTTPSGEEQSELHSEDNPSLLEMPRLMVPEVSVVTEEPQEHGRATEIKGDVHSFPAEEGVNVAVGSLPGRSRGSSLASCGDVLEDKDHRPEVKEVEPGSGVDEEQSTFSTEPGNMVSCAGGFQGPARGSTAHFPLNPAPARNTCEEAVWQETSLGLIISKNADPNPEKSKLLCSVEQSRPGGFKANGVEQKGKTQAGTSEHVCTDSPTEAHVVDTELAELAQGPENKELAKEESKGKVEIGERSKKVTFLLGPEVLREARLTESVAPMGPSTRVSGENLQPVV